MNISGNGPAHTLHDENRAAQSLLDLLNQEQAQLIAADIDGLTGLTEEKTRLVAQMSALATRRYAALTAAGFASGEAGMQCWLEQSDTAAADAWRQLLSLAQAAKEVNRVNGLLIGKHLTRNQASLNLLKGGPQAQTLYGPNGQSSVKTNARGLAIG